VLNYEEGENSILHGDAASEALLSEIVGAAPWPGQRHWNTESVSMSRAAPAPASWRVWRMFTERQVLLAIHGVATALMRSPDQVAAVREAGWQIASQWWIEKGSSFTPPGLGACIAKLAKRLVKGFASIAVRMLTSARGLLPLNGI